MDGGERSVKTVQLDLVRAKFVKLQDKCRELWTTYQSLRCKKEGNDNVFRLFGGRAAFQRLPVLDIGDRSNERTSHIDFIRTNEITAPVMRGRDKFGREFFTIRATRGISRRSYQVFFQREVVGGCWGKATVIDQAENMADWQAFPDGSGYITDEEGKVYRDGCYATLAQLIATRTVVDNEAYWGPATLTLE